MTGWQWLLVGVLFALALAGIPGYALGWWNGRRCLRAALDVGRLPPVELGLRFCDQADTLPIAGRFPVVPPMLESELLALGDKTVRQVHEWTVAAQMTDAALRAAERRIPPKWRDQP